MLGITLEELNVWRKETRQNAGVEVKSADLNNGILSIHLEKIIPEAMKPKTIQIK